MVLSLGRLRIDVRRDERASGISLRRRPVKMSARLATWRRTELVTPRSITTAERMTRRGGDRLTCNVFFLSEHLAEQLTGADAQGAAEHVHLLEVVASSQVGRWEARGRRPCPASAPSLEGEDGGGSHGGKNRERLRGKRRCWGVRSGVLVSVHEGPGWAAGGLREGCDGMGTGRRGREPGGRLFCMY